MIPNVTAPTFTSWERNLENPTQHESGVIAEINSNTPLDNLKVPRKEAIRIIKRYSEQINQINVSNLDGKLIRELFDCCPHIRYWDYI